MKNLILAGIYDKRTVEKAKELDIFNLTFDFRPRSFNFIQQYVLDNILDSLESGIYKINLQFENEADFVVKNLVDGVLNKGHECKLIFSDLLTPKFYDQFNRSYINYYQPELDLSLLLKSNLNEGLIFKYSFLHELFTKGLLQNFITNFYSVSMKNAGNIKSIGLELDWDSNIATTILDLIEADFYTVAINGKIEICYRNVDSEKLKTHIKFIQQHTC